jgi:hypothetical protein
MARTLIVFEDEGFSRLYPLTLMRPVWDLTCGILRIKEKLLWGLRRAAIDKPEWRDFTGDGLGVLGGRSTPTMKSPAGAAWRVW